MYLPYLKMHWIYQFHASALHCSVWLAYFTACGEIDVGLNICILKYDGCEGLQVLTCLPSGRIKYLPIKCIAVKIDVIMNTITCIPRCLSNKAKQSHDPKIGPPVLGNTEGGVLFPPHFSSSKVYLLT